MSSQLQIRKYQRQSIDAVFKAWESGDHRALLVLATGLGKTVVGGALIDEFHRKHGRARVLFLAHREELLNQAEEKLSFIAPHLKCKYITGKANDYNADVVFSTMQTLGRDTRLAHVPVDDIDFVIVDEAHHAVSPQYLKILSHLGCHQRGGKRLLGLTATPERADGVGLDEVFDRVVFKMSILRGIVFDYLCDLRAKRVEIDLDLNKIGTAGGDFDEQQLSRELLRSNLDKYVVEAWTEHAQGRKTVVFVPSINLCETVAQTFRDAGIEAWSVHGEQPKVERKRLLDDFQEDKFPVIVNAMMLTEGWDCPAVSCCIIARPTKSSALYKQMVGRGTRRHPSKNDTLVLDIVGADHENPNIVTLDNISGFTLDEVQGGLRQAIQDRLDAEKSDQKVPPAARPVPRKEMAETNVRDRNLFAEMNWLELPNGGYVLSLGDGTNFLLQPETADPGVTPRYRVILRQARIPDVVLAMDLPLDYAQGLGEDAVRERETLHLATKNQAFRKDPATEKQKEALRRMGINFDDDITKGDASDLITIATAVGPKFN